MAITHKIWNGKRWIESEEPKPIEKTVEVKLAHSLVAVQEFIKTHEVMFALAATEDFAHSDDDFMLVAGIILGTIFRVLGDENGGLELHELSERMGFNELAVTV